MLVIAYNTQLKFKSQEDSDKIFEILNLHLWAVNFASERHFGAVKNSLVELHRKVYYKIREEKPEIPACVITRAITECLSNYHSVKSNKHKIIKPITKKNLSIRLDHNLYKIKGDKIKLTTIDKRIEADIQMYPKLQELFQLYRCKDPLLFVKNGEIWISLPFETPVTPSPRTLALGVDMGCRRFLSTSEGNILKDEKYNGEKRKLRYLKRKLQSKNTKSARRHLKKIRRKERNKSKQFLHLAANWLLDSTKANVLAFEDLSGIKKKKFKFQDKNRIGQMPWFEFKTIVTYKAHFIGKEVQTVPAAFTSQTDHRTGRKGGERRGCRYYSKRNLIYDADINAAINIGKKTRLPVSQTKNLTYGQAVVTRPIVCKSSSKEGV